MNRTSPRQPRSRRRWPLVLLAAPAAVAIWSGWVDLGQMCGFGLVHPLPGIADGVQLNTAITLPVGVEAYSAYALGIWLSATGIPTRARRFGACSAVAALTLGLVGQVIYHVLEALGYTRAPIPIVVFVSSLPVLALGAAATLHHLTDNPDNPDRDSHTPAAPGMHGAASDAETETTAGAITAAVAEALPTPSWPGTWLTSAAARAELTGSPTTTPPPADHASKGEPANTTREPATTDTRGTNHATTTHDTTAVNDTNTDTGASAAGQRPVAGGAELLSVARQIETELAEQGLRLTRRRLVDRLRERVGSCSNERALELLRHLRAENDDHIGQLEAVS